MKRIGLYVFLIAAAIISVELALSILRQRSLDVSVRVEGSTLPQASVNVGRENDSAAGVALSPQGVVIVDVRWSYRIGPRFPVTQVRAEVQDSNGAIVAADVYTIDCGASSLDCSGAEPLELRFGVTEGITEGQGERAVWPRGTYSLVVTRSYLNGSPTQLLAQPVVVEAAN